ncbi:hypothetical protein AGABI2DRAFT_192792 [Agaricus bisporus var. bisporus H97]|uniref:hypothetical protein n=1 Tax=Agaricus bisporus var. bisporus (strain H97 / ATCC MYA-4626 / FGSC 10389) TaxID=936046 RepID=UPI00029F656F|nr:hypothetical protein AGABI2DRAFT_192792 [Agaricus bisporus var. bisporus H97]EKV47613.1 hypothetical protein AGABI2DRAFT_192792 [Agaricus bisporus var. bisporus H97]
MARRRAPSSVLVKQLSPLHDLPSEIIIHIIECALCNDRPSDLALISPIIRHFVNTTIYRTVALGTSHIVTLLHRTAVSPRSSFLLTHVKRLAITCGHGYIASCDTEQRFRQIISKCPGLRSLAIPSLRQVNISPSVISSSDGPSDLTIRTFEDISDTFPLNSKPQSPHALFSSSLTHLRICEPGDTWQSPLSIIAAFHGAPNLTHLQLARRADSNKNNDIIFVDHIAQLLSSRKSLKKVVITIFGGPSRLTPYVSRESGIWMLVSKLQEFDSRVVVVEGELGKWSEGWKDTKRFRCGGHPINFWNMV